MGFFCTTWGYVRKHGSVFGKVNELVWQLNQNKMEDNLQTENDVHHANDPGIFSQRTRHF